MFNNGIVQTVIAGLILSLLGYLGLKSKKIWKRTKSIWNSPNKVRNGISQAEFDSFRDEVRKLVKPIQPDSNGGKSLPDAIALMHSIKEDLVTVKERQTFIGDTAVATQAMLKLHIETKNAHL